MKRFARTQQQLADALGLTRGGIQKHVERGGPKKTARGYHIEQWRQYLDGLRMRAPSRDALRKTAGDAEPAAGHDLGGQDMTELKRLKELETVRKIQIDNLTKAGKLVRVNWHEEQMAAMAGELQSELKTMVRSLPPEIAGLPTVEAQKVLERAVNGIIAKMSRGKIPPDSGEKT